MNIHLGASGILEIDGLVLLGRRVKDDPYCPGMWCTPGCGVNFRETVDAAVVREFKAETNLDVRVIGEFQSFQERIDREKNKHSVVIFRQVRMAWHLGTSETLEPLGRFSALRWFTKDELNSNFAVTSMSYRALMKYFRI